MNCDRTIKALERSFIEGRPEDLDAFRSHLSACPKCAARAQRLYGFEAALGRRPVPGPMREILAHKVVGEVLQREGARSGRRVSWWMGAFSIAAAAAVVVVVVVPPSGEDGFVARGNDVADVGDLALRAVCLEQGPAGFEARSVTAAGCGLGGALGFTARNVTGQNWYLQISVTLPGGEERLVFPPAGGTGRLAPGPDEQPLPVTVPLSGARGLVGVTGLFSTEVLPRGRVFTVGSEAQRRDIRLSVTVGTPP